MSRRWRARLVVVVLVALCATVGGLMWRHAAVNEVQANTPVVAIDEIVVRGRLEPRTGRYEVSAYTVAAVAPIGQMLVQEGQSVAKGELLATLITRKASEARLRVAAATLEVAEKRLERVRRPYKSGEIAALRAAVEARVADLELAKRRGKRSEELIEKGITARDDHEARMASLDRAEAALKEAQARLKAMTEISETELQLAKAQVAEAKANLRDAEAQHALTEVRAPVNGVILKIHTKAGEAVSGRAIIEMGDMLYPKAVAEVDERIIDRVKVGQKARVFLPGGNRYWTARVTSVRGLVQDLGRSPANAVSARGARIVEVDLALDNIEALPPISGIELLVRIKAS